MSRIGKLPIPLASTVKVEVNGSYVKVTGPRGNLDRTVDSEIRLHLEDGRLVVTRPSDEPRHPTWAKAFVTRASGSAARPASRARAGSQ